MRTGIKTLSRQLFITQRGSYFLKLRLDPAFLDKLFKLAPNGKIRINTPTLISGLDIKISQMPPSKIRRSFTGAMAIEAAKNLLTKQSPDDWEFDPTASEITAEKFKRDMLVLLLSLEEAKEDHPAFPVFRQISEALASNDEKAINAVYRTLSALRVLPPAPRDGDKVIEVAGLNNIHYYKTRVCYFIVSNSGNFGPSAEYVMIGPPELGWQMTAGSLESSGDLQNGLYQPGEKLWREKGD